MNASTVCDKRVSLHFCVLKKKIIPAESGLTERETRGGKRESERERERGRERERARENVYLNNIK